VTVMLDRDKSQTFNDGLVKIYNLDSDDGDGGMPTRVPKLVTALRFRELGLTMRRQYEAKAINMNIDRIIRVPGKPGIQSDFLAVVTDRDGTEQYRIRTVERITQTTPPTLTLSLEKEGDHYEFETN
jgi:hypothetical protein